MKKTAGVICFASFCAGAVWVEYEAILRFGGTFVLITGASALAALSAALYHAPEGREGVDGFRIRPRRPRPHLLPHTAARHGSKA